MDKTFIRKAKEIVDQNMAESTFDVVSFSPELSISRHQLHRKLRIVILMHQHALDLALLRHLDPLGQALVGLQLRHDKLLNELTPTTKKEAA